MTADFAKLYSQLGIRTDCSLEEFKQACRRRIRAQHPDRSGADDNSVATQIPLAELLPLYARALRFHRKHGRLPGAAPVPTRAASPKQGELSLVAAPTAMPTDEEVPRASLRGLLLMILLAVVVLVLFNSTNDESPAAGQQPIGTAMPEEADVQFTPSEQLLEIGMDTESVREIQGEPMQKDGSEWIYGPSWLRFERGRLVDWYSSPLHALKTATSSPPVEEAEQDPPVDDLR